MIFQNDELARLMREILFDPTDTDRRMVFADCLLEQGRTEYDHLAHLIRHQVVAHNILIREQGIERNIDELQQAFPSDINVRLRLLMDQLRQERHNRQEREASATGELRQCLGITVPQCVYDIGGVANPSTILAGNVLVNLGDQRLTLGFRCGFVEAIRCAARHFHQLVTRGLFNETPLQYVQIANSRPRRDGEYFVWDPIDLNDVPDSTIPGGGLYSYQIPSEICQCMMQYPISNNNGTTQFANEFDAMEALGYACLCYGRTFANLPIQPPGVILHQFSDFAQWQSGPSLRDIP